MKENKVVVNESNVRSYLKCKEEEVMDLKYADSMDIFYWKIMDNKNPFHCN